MTTATQSRKVATQKTVLILARYFIFATQSVVYLVRNGGGKEYQVTLNQNGTSVCIQTNGEPCPSTRGSHKCYHIKSCETVEQSRIAREAEEQFAREQAEAVRAAEAMLLSEREDEEEEEAYQQWKRDNGLDQPLSREAYDMVFDPHGFLL